MVNEHEENYNYNTSPKKAKLPKAPPQRGLGVARLEKILKEQTHDIVDDNLISSLPMSHNSPPIAAPPPPPPPPPPKNDSIFSHLSLIQNLDPFIPPPLPMTTLCNNPLGNGGNSCDYFNEEHNTKMDSRSPFPFHYLDTIDPFWPSNMNVYLPNVLSSSSSSVEPPSSQKSYNYKSMLPEDPQMIGTKRHCPFAFENEPIPFPPQRNSSCLNHLSKKDQLQCSCEIQSTFSFEPFKLSSRDSIREAQFEQSSKKETNFDTCETSFLTLGPPSSSSQSTDEFNSTQLLGSTGDSRVWSVQGETSNQEAFNSLLLQNGDCSTTSNSIDKRHKEEAENSIDLNLKMSVGSPFDQSFLFLKKSN